MMQDLMSFDRRALMQRVALLIGATAIPADVFAAGSKAKAKRFLNPAQFALISAVADTVIPTNDTPGALAAGVPRRFDGLLSNWASAKRKVQLTAALAAIDQLAMTSDKKAFAALTPARRKALLVEHDKSALKPGAPSKEKLNGILAMLAGPPVVNPGWLKLKELIIALYYTSEIAMTKELIYEHVPGPFVASMKVTPETRPFSGLGGLF
jgi:gluconate 2-dehydrogenase gamma chain